LHESLKYSSHLTPPLFSEVPAPNMEGEQSCICVLGVSILPMSLYDFSIRFWNCYDSVVFFVFHFISTLYLILNWPMRIC